ncbi:MAG: hypothetical protein P0Y49_03315 [Candidatus Pedobacter colombiensis]|uniref:Uncharacterized protein n=1 Tax=Candidatus Pedobacter colombiensis TaxID=3121371 RepID=A0AAJ6B9G7_9SPHI|nr:hypothetical protein [Pedobacter sp.]WEK20178.1 MAG: hypothetical protein P0Y49_03315 [Pedobacter sp.]
MKRIVSSIVLLLLVVAVKAQTVTWESPTAWVSSGSYTTTINNTSYTYNSDFLYANFWLDVDGRTLHYNVTVKNIPSNPGNMIGEFQATIANDGSPMNLFANKQVLWNAPLDYSNDPSWERESYPISSEYSYAGSCDLGSTSDLQISAGILFWNQDDYSQGSEFNVFPRINP